MTDTAPEAIELTETLLSIIRQQRHLGARVMVATQEPTMSPALLDLCNVTIVHRFTSPAWFEAIKKHIAGASMSDDGEAKSVFTDQLFQQIVKLKTGEALVFCPTAILDAVWVGSGNTSTACSEADGDSDSGVEINAQSVSQLGPRYFNLRVRKRVTADGGRSQLSK